ncbi:hypothetical protein HPB49_003888 [Dermacentor silvarum]|uniref:Uncharacterized protein n=1 Tax=Dermacentor silvarum TaxID=543639 RepID=A0ACB8DAH9_DERSI|nr:hypothetical protein HPB49_003888 [Dermacentor silvarum]
MSNRQVKHRVMSIKEKLDIINDIQRGAKKSVLAREKGLPLSTVCGIWAAREKVLNGAPSNLKRCRLRGSSYPDVEEALFVVPAVSAQEINPSEVDADEEAADDSDCEALLAEVLDRQGGGDRVPFLAFCDVDNDVETCEDLTDSDIVNSLSSKLCSASDGEDDDNAELEDVPCPTDGATPEWSRRPADDHPLQRSLHLRRSTESHLRAPTTIPPASLARAVQLTSRLRVGIKCPPAEGHITTTLPRSPTSAGTRANGRP